jgi:hypothetical protein
MTVYWVVWDAAAAWIVDRLDAEGALPAVRRLRATGARFTGRPPSPNCQTPPSLASLFTGCAAHEHGVTGFDVPGGPADPVTTSRSGFTPDLLARPPVWQLAEQQGLRTAFVHAPWVFAGDGSVGARVVGAVEAYRGQVAPAELMPVAETDHTVGPFQVRLRALTAGARLTVPDGTGEREIDLDAERGWVPVRLASAGRPGFWARYLVGPDGPAVARTGVWRQRVAGSDPRLVDQLGASSVFAGAGLKKLYRKGKLGARLVDGGDGTAEDVFLSSLHCVARCFADAVRVVAPGQPGPADLVVIYLPFTDDIGHEIAGWCDPESAAYRPDHAPALWAAVRRCYAWADAMLGRVLDSARPADTVILAADHGIVGASHLVAVNECLAAAGLAVVQPDGALDPRSSRVVYHPANNGSLRVNHDGLPGGSVPRNGCGELLREAAAALRALTAAHGRGVVTGFLDAAGRPLDPIGLPPDLDVMFVVLDDNYQPTAAIDGQGPLRVAGKPAAHIVNTGAPRLYATGAIAGPGIAAGADLGVIDNTAVAGLVLARLPVLATATREGAR